MTEWRVHGTRRVYVSEWVPLNEIRQFIRKGLISDGISLAALATYLTLRAT